MKGNSERGLVGLPWGDFHIILVSFFLFIFSLFLLHRNVSVPGMVVIFVFFLSFGVC